MEDDLDEVALNVLLAEGLDIPTSLEGATRETPVTQPRRQASSWVQLAVVLAALLVAALLVAGAVYLAASQ